MSRRHLLSGSALIVIAFVTSVQAQQTPSSDTTTYILPEVTVNAPTDTSDGPVSPQIQKYSLPQTVESIDRKKIDETVNIVDVEDAIKYMPSLLVRKRNYGDTQPTLATRTWGINSSARNLVYVDDMPISALIANNNTNGAPRWGVVSPEEISGIDMLYGPFSAQYPGNSMGGVLLMTTRDPQNFEATAKQTFAWQDFSYYKTSDSYLTSNSAATVGGKQSRFSWFLNFNNENSWSQPLGFVTNATAPAGTSGTISALNKTGGAANVVGASGLLHSIMNNVSGKFAANLTDTIKATYLLGYWNNDTSSKVQTYLTDSSGNPTFGNVSGFGTSTYDLNEQHLMNALSVKSDTKGMWDWEAVATRYDYLQDIQRASAGVNGGTAIKTNGTIARLDGSGWWTADLKGIWRPTGTGGEHEASFGVHEDQYTLKNPTFNTPNWMASPDNGNGTYSTYGKGNTQTDALWAQDAWKFARDLKFTAGLRAEQWQAYDGYNLASNGVSTIQPKVTSANISPKGSLAWYVDPAWTSTLSYGEAFRYPTVSELYQIVSSGITFVSPNANLQPEHVYSWELAVQRQDDNSNLRVSLFQENTNNALISQTSTINGTITTSFQNVNEIRNRGVEVAAGMKNALIKGLDLSNSVTYVDSKILSDPNFASSGGTTATGKRVPYVPDWRDTVQATYHQDENLSYSASARYQGQMYSTLDNTDSVSSVYGAFDKFFVFDAHVHYNITEALSADAGVDNLFDERYFLFHPFPGRTFVASVRMKF